MKRLLLAVLLDSISVIGVGQERSVDSLARRIEHYPGTDTTLVDLRNDYVEQALFTNPDSALLSYTNETLTLARQLEYGKGILQSEERLGLIYQYAQGDPYRALSHYQQAMRITETDPALLRYQSGIIGNMGNIYYEQEEYETALSCFRRILTYHNEMELAATANIGNIYGNLGQNDSAIYYFEKAIGMARASSNWVFVANGLSNLSLIQGRMGNTDEAVRSIDESLALIKQFDMGFVRTTAYVNAAMAYLARHDLQRAEQFALDAMRLDKSLDNLSTQKSVWGTLSDIYAAQGRYREALDAHKRYEDYKDSLNNQNRRVEINRKQMQFGFEKQDALAQAEIRRQSSIKNVAFVCGGGLALALLLAFVLYKRKRDAVARQRDAEFGALVADTELKALRAQLNPHFIFNSLNSISDYIAKNDREIAQEYLARFAHLMRQALENTDKKEVLLADDLSFTELYLKMEVKRLGGKFAYAIHVDERIDPENTLVPPLLLQPFVENCIWHGFARKESGGYIRIGIKKEGNMLTCTVLDNGQGLRQGLVRHNQQSMGIRLTETRLAIQNREKQTNGRLTVTNRKEGSGVLVKISLPLEQAF